MKKFWMVLNVDSQGSTATKKHETKKSAFDEAERLAKANPKTRFVVLETIKGCVKNDVFWQELEE